MTEEIEITIVPTKIGTQPVVATKGFKSAGLPEVIYAIPVQADPDHDYTDLIRSRGMLLSEFAKHVVEDPNVMFGGLLPSQGVVLGFNHKQDSERLYYLTPINILTKEEITEETNICDSIIVNMILISRDVIKDLNKDIEVMVFE